MNTDRTLVFAGENETDARQLVATLKARDIGGTLRSAFYFDGAEPCGKIIIMPDVPGFHADKIREAFPGKYDAPAPRDDFVRSIKQADAAPPEAKFNNIDKLLSHLNDDHAAEQESAARAAVAERAALAGAPKRRGRPRKHPQT